MSLTKFGPSVAAAVALLCAWPAAAQTVPMVIVGSCGTATLTRGALTMTADGALCTAGTGGGAPSNVNVAQFGGNNVVTGTGASGIGIPRVTVSSDSTVAVTGGAFGTASDTAWSGSGDSTGIAALKAIYNNLAATVLGNGTAAGSIRVAVASDSPVSLTSLFPSAATPITASATGTTAATTATLAGTVGKTTYICGFSITSDATAGLAGTATVTGTVTGTLNYIQGVGVAPAVAAVNQSFGPCVPAGAVNTGIVVTSAAAGTGGNTAVTAWGFQL